MSGHSHAKTVKRTKDANDAKRGRIFSKLSRMISLAAKQGRDPETNSQLRQSLDEAKRFNMPKDNVEKAIKRGAGEIEGAQLESVMYEAIGPGGINIILEGITDNKNRTLAEVRQLLQKNNSKLAGEGSLQWAFEQKGIIIVNVGGQGGGESEGGSGTGLENKAAPNKEALELRAIEAGAEDINWQKDEDEEFMEITIKPENLEKVKAGLEGQGVRIASSALGWTAKEEVAVSEKDREACRKLFEDLDDSESIQEIYSNLKL